MADITTGLGTASDRSASGSSAGANYTSRLTSIRDTVDGSDNANTTLGTMISAQLDMTAADTSYQVEVGMPTKVTKSVNETAKSIKQG